MIWGLIGGGEGHRPIYSVLIPVSPSEIPPLRVNVSLDASKRSLRSLWSFFGSSERNNHC